MITAGERPVMAKKAPKRYGTLVRVSDQFAEALRLVTRFEDVSAAEFCDRHFLPIATRRYEEWVLKRAKDIEARKK
jgi:hypothetical protein